MRIAINGFGRIGRHTLRNLITRGIENVEVVAINDLTDAKALSHLFKYDSVHGPFPGTVSYTENSLRVDAHSIRTLNIKNPTDLPWGELNIDVVIESTGLFTTKEKASQHLAAGARQVIISAPSPDKEIPTVVLGINDSSFDWNAPIFSNASCTTNNVAPLVKILDENWQIQDGYITTVHSMTGDQNLHDSPHRDLRRARAASSSIIPTTTGAAKAITNVFTHLEGKLGGAGIRVPVLNGSLTDFTCTLSKKTTVAEINAKFREAAMHELKDVLYYTEDPIVSVDIINNPYSCVFDAQLTSIVGGLVKVVGWYDNEFGYSNRLVDILDKLSKR
ncbi:type I glyceraldehyde-3-phosphate dehydrogenase [Sphingobacterium alkalisoli]|uniref:Type I glyceraldehyde-3-phosphate dehydrogenase n=1 Tax=Sphingobacterium alkalisoli TaxID=1874115 RepID=A0A4U0H5C7_9SPHI|nr:type I glyceraldehyde-3-phosphate dehydrogenase [Sphingobacterium alkalisoli]TJY66925.1 type I glyceraldehyde-3-phosphate dehydrogenase [Sphingobacterium alkalisoli]GGH13350.1 type I glyceraldehyde-3-phosphate dehydrogenase [Sphingobacterium alkalisoli]